MSLLRVEHLYVSFQQAQRRQMEVVKDMSFTLPNHRTLGIVGESGSGKSVTALSLLRLLPRNAQIAGRVHFAGRDLLSLSSADLRRVRGRDIAMIFQDPMTALNPVLTIGQQLMEPLRLHVRLSRAQAHERALALLDEVGITESRARLSAFAHELSGGQQQRVMIAMALACQPALLIADEPTTALDATVQKQIIELLRDIQTRRQMSMLFISHDLNLVGQIADEIMVMRAGEIQERASVKQLFRAPSSAYTEHLLRTRPRLITQPTNRVLSEHILLDVQQLNKTYTLRTGWWRRKAVQVVRDVSFQVRQGSTLGIVGESGSGKTTTALLLLGLVPATSGVVKFDGTSVLSQRSAQWRALRKRMQIVFQNPYASLNPRYTIAHILAEPLRIHRLAEPGRPTEQRMRALLESVGLTADALDRYPHEFSGGQRQRIALARSLAVEPELIVFDEAVAALDVSVQADILQLLRDLQRERGLTYLFISHDLAVVSSLADELIVMQNGSIVERGACATVLTQPSQAYTRQLIDAVPAFFSSQEYAPSNS